MPYGVNNHDVSRSTWAEDKGNVAGACRDNVKFNCKTQTIILICSIRALHAYCGNKELINASGLLTCVELPAYVANSNY